MLLSLGAQIEKPLNTNFDRLTPLMLASANGNLVMVTMLITEYRAKVEKMDKFKRTALTHAIMNGASNVASYLVNLGANVNKCDSSGKTFSEGTSLKAHINSVHNSKKDQKCNSCGI